MHALLTRVRGSCDNLCPFRSYLRVSRVSRPTAKLCPGISGYRRHVHAERAFSARYGHTRLENAIKMGVSSKLGGRFRPSLFPAEIDFLTFVNVSRVPCVSIVVNVPMQSEIPSDKIIIFSINSNNYIFLLLQSA